MVFNKQLDVRDLIFPECSDSLGVPWFRCTICLLPFCPLWTDDFIYVTAQNHVLMFCRLDCANHRPHWTVKIKLTGETYLSNVDPF